MPLNKTIKATFLGWLAMFALVASAQASLTAHQTVEETTDRVMTLIEEANSYFSEDPDRFYQAIGQVLDDVVDFQSFARGVMGPYASKAYYDKLQTQEEKRAFRAQVMRFADSFKEGLVQTYAKGLLAFGGTRVEIVPPEQAETGRSATVLQKIYSDEGKAYEVYYKMRRDKRGQWKMRNVTIEAVNLGKVYQGQFLAAVKQYEGDINKVIENWSVAPSGLEGAEKSPE